MDRVVPGRAQAWPTWSADNGQAAHQQLSDGFGPKTDRWLVNTVPVNPADDILHLVLGVGTIALGLALTRRSRVVSEDRAS